MHSHGGSAATMITSMLIKQDLSPRVVSCHVLMVQAIILNVDEPVNEKIHALLHGIDGIYLAEYVNLTAE